jgi:hypothetical protein
MTLTPPASYRTRLQDAVDELWLSVGELALTVLDDRPDEADLAVLDAFAEQVSELQGAVAGARELLTVEPERARQAAPAELPSIAAHLDAAWAIYWSELRRYERIGEVRRAARRCGPAALAWRSGVDASLQRCEAPLATTREALLASWNEVHQQLELLTRTVHPAAPACSQPAPNHRRSS